MLELNFMSEYLKYTFHIKIPPQHVPRHAVKFIPAETTDDKDCAFEMLPAGVWLRKGSVMCTVQLIFHPMTWQAWDEGCPSRSSSC